MIQVRPRKDRGMVLQVHLSGPVASLVRRTEKPHSPVVQIKARKTEADKSRCIMLTCKLHLIF